MRSQALIIVLMGLAVACGNGAPSGTDAPPGGTDGPPPISYVDPLAPEGSLGNGSATEPLEIEEIQLVGPDRMAYCTARRGVVIVDIGNPAMLREVARIDSGPCQHLAADGQILYVVHRGGTVQDPGSRITAYDLSGDRPTMVATLAAPESTSFEGAHAAGNRVYVAAHAGGLQIWELSGNALVPRGSLDEGLVNAWDVVVADNVAYVADARGFVVTIEVSNPDAPALLGSVAVRGSPMALVKGGALVYVGAGYGGISIVDVADPASPRVAGSASVPGSALSLALEDDGSGGGRYLYVAAWHDVRVFDVRYPSVPALVATETPASALPVAQVRAVAAQAGTLYLGEWTKLWSYAARPLESAPELWLARREVRLQVATPGGTAASALVVRNEGTVPLVAQIAVEGAAFATDVSSLTIAPGGSDVIEVSYQPAALGPDLGQVVIRSDDPDEGEVMVPLLGNTPGLAVGDAAPEIAVSLLYGGEWRTSQELGNVALLSYFATF